MIRKKWCVPLLLHVWINVTPHTYICRWCRIQQQDCWLVLRNMSTSLQSWPCCISFLSILESSLRFCWLFWRLLMGRSQFISPVLFIFYQLPGLSDPLAKISHMTHGHVSNKKGRQSLCSHSSTVLESVTDSHKKSPTSLLLNLSSQITFTLAFPAH